MIPGGISVMRSPLGCAVSCVARFRNALISASTLGLAALALTAFAPVSALAETCPNEQFRTGPSAGLPDCRAYELVTPPFKDGAPFRFKVSFGLETYIGMSTAGTTLAVSTLGNPGDARQNLSYNSYDLTRGESGWVEHANDLSDAQFPASEIAAGSPEVDAFAYKARSTDQPLTAASIWVHNADGTLVELGPFRPPAETVGPPGAGPGLIGGNVHEDEAVRGASADLSHVVFGSPVSWPGDEALADPYGQGDLYEYVQGRGGPPIPVGVEPDGQLCGATFQDISPDGSQVLFRCPNGLFDRVDGTHTVAISTPSAADCSACHASTPTPLDGPIAAAAGGSKVFFTTERKLLSGGPFGLNIYEYDFEAPAASPQNPDGRISDITDGEWGEGTQLQRVVKVSADGSHVYFFAQGVLQGVTNSRGEAPLGEEKENLYVYQRDAQFPTGHLSFIASFPEAELYHFFTCAGKLNNGQACGATTTPDGRFLVFTSGLDLTAGDTSTAQQVFEYDAQTGALVRVSIGQGGFNDNGNTDAFSAEIPEQQGSIEGEAGIGGGLYPLAVSNDGSYVVFQSADGLTPGALNGFHGEFAYAQNVYEYHNGNVYLISDGQDTSHHEEKSSVQVVGLSPSGQDVFFETADQLVGQDVDSQLDIYDARIDGGFAAPVSLLPSCSGDACQGELSAAPVLLSPGSEFQAGGNPPLAGGGAPSPAAAVKPKPKSRPAACRKGYVKRHAKCVKKPKSKRGSAKKSSRDRKGKS